MACHLHLLRLQSPSHIYRASPWTTKAKPHLSLNKKRMTVSIHARGGRGFGTTSVSEDKPRQQANNSDEGGGDEEDAIPDAVFNRMLVRVVGFVGVPMASGVGLLYVMSLLKEQGIWESPRWLPFLTILLCFGTSALGIAYGTVSASWDPEKEGSLLGWEQAQKNWPELWKVEDEGGK